LKVFITRQLLPNVNEELTFQPKRVDARGQHWNLIDLISTLIRSN